LRTDRLHGVVAGAVAVLAVLAGILLVNLLNGPSDGTSTAAAPSTSPSSPPATPSAAASEQPSESASPAAPATTSRPSAAPSTAAATQPPPSPRPPAAPPRVFTTVTIFNDSRIQGLAEAAVVPVEAAGFTVDRVAGYYSRYDVPVTTVFYDPEDEAAARTMLDTVDGVERMIPRSETSILETGTLILVVTKDFPVD
jgi:hypothetical protein